MCRSLLYWSFVMLPVLCLPVLGANAEESPALPRTVEALWSDFDPRREPLDVRLVRELAGGARWQTVSFSPEDFHAVGGQESLSSWAELDLLGFRAYADDGESLLGSRSWSGSQPAFRNVRWTQEQGTP
jgi:hypothetical protein